MPEQMNQKQIREILNRTDYIRVSGTADEKKAAEYLKELCESTGGGYIDIAEALKDENNYLLEEYSSDKICHISDEGLVIWIERMKDYAQEQYDAGLWDPFESAGESLPEGGNEP